jgi:methylmalonyl-CoA mutase N-terminal domain/subunit
LAARGRSRSARPEIEEEARELIAKIDSLGGTLAAIESGWIQRQVQDAAYAAQQAIDSGTQVIVGVNRYQTDEPAGIELLRIDPAGERRQADAVRALRQSRDVSTWRSSMESLERAATDGTNLVPPVLAAVEARATLGEIADAMRRCSVSIVTSSPDVPLLRVTGLRTLFPLAGGREACRGR